MFDYMAKYEDMGYYYVTISKQLIESALENLKKNMGFIFEKSGIYCFTEEAIQVGRHIIPKADYERQFYLYKKSDDERAYVLAREWREPYFGIAVKCRTSEKELFLYTLEAQRLESYELDGIPYIKINDYPDYTYRDHNDVENALRTVGLIK